MRSPDTIGAERAVFSHQVQALLARQAKDDREAIGATLGRAGFRNQVSDKQKGGGVARRAKLPVNKYLPDFHTASPLTGRDRQTGGVRIPHFDMKPITSTFAPKNKEGVAHSRHKNTMTAAEHINYITDGARIGIGAHIDYISRETGTQDPAIELVLDMLDEQDLRNEKNLLAYYTNIPGDRERQRGLFEAAERSEPPPKTFCLNASTADLGAFGMLLKMGIAPDWFRVMAKRLEAALEEAERDAKSRGEPARHRNVPIAEVTSEEAFARLTWLDRYPVADAIKCMQGRTGRTQYRFVGELPYGLSPQERHAILGRFCGTLNTDGWMVVGAIHQPDVHNDLRNYHVHVDGYDRPATWMDEHDCWDFEYVVRKNGKNTKPYQQNKVQYREQNEDGTFRKVDTAALMRDRFITIVNEVVGERPDIVRYLHGTYADHDIGLTPLEHMGNRAIALEQRGIVTETGSRNARRIVEDEVTARQKRADTDMKSLVGEMAIVRSIVAESRDALEAVDKYELLQRRLIQRRLQADLADIVIALANSRSDAVIRTLTDGPRWSVKMQEKNAELLASAQLHKAWVDRNSPTAQDRETERRLLVTLEARAANAWTMVEAAIGRCSKEPGRRTPMVYRPRIRQNFAQTVPVASRFDNDKRKRLAAWLNKNAADPLLLVIDDLEISLGVKVPPSIDTFLRQFASEPRFQGLFFAEQDRRRTLSMAPKVKERQTSARVPKSAIHAVRMIPVEEWAVSMPSEATAAAGKRSDPGLDIKPDRLITEAAALDGSPASLQRASDFGDTKGLSTGPALHAPRILQNPTEHVPSLSFAGDVGPSVEAVPQAASSETPELPKPGDKSGRIFSQTEGLQFNEVRSKGKVPKTPDLSAALEKDVGSSGEVVAQAASSEKVLSQPVGAPASIVPQPAPPEVATRPVRHESVAPASKLAVITAAGLPIAASVGRSLGQFLDRPFRDFKARRAERNRFAQAVQDSRQQEMDKAQAEGDAHLRDAREILRDEAEKQRQADLETSRQEWLELQPKQHTAPPLIRLTGLKDTYCHAVPRALRTANAKDTSCGTFNASKRDLVVLRDRPRTSASGRIGLRDLPVVALAGRLRPVAVPVPPEQPTDVWRGVVDPGVRPPGAVREGGSQGQGSILDQAATAVPVTTATKSKGLTLTTDIARAAAALRLKPGLPTPPEPTVEADQIIQAAWNARNGGNGR